MLRRALALALLVLPGCALPPEAAPPRLPARPDPGTPRVPPELRPEGGLGGPAAEAEGAPADEAMAFAGSDDELAALDDDEEEAEVGATPRTAPKSPLLSLSDAELSARYKADPASVGPISAGPPRGGVLINGVQMPASDRVLLLDAGRAWGTRETVDALVHIIDRVHARFPDTPPLPIGHISARHGGHLSPHLSHQSGRDVDVGYYHRTPIRGFVTATEQNLDMGRTWALVKAAVKETDVDMVLMDTSIQRLLANYAAMNGEDPAFLDEAFQIRGKNARAPIRHIKGHANHLHFRFHNPVAEELGRRLARHITFPKPAPVTSAHHAEVAGVTFAQHRARSGDTLVILAKRYGTTVEDIQKANGLRGNALRAGATYRIPQKAPAKPVVAPAKGGPKPAPAAPGKKPAAAPGKPPPPPAKPGAKATK